MRRLILTIAAAMTLPVAPLLPQRPAGEFAAFQAALDSLAATNHLPGYSAVIVRDGQVVWQHGWGWADLERRIPATPDTPYRLASLSKPIAATLLMQLVEEHRLSLDDPMRKYPILAWFEPGGGSWAHYPSRYADGAITVRHVLTHTSQATPPGSAYAYSGNIFGDLTFVIEAVTRHSFPREVQRRFLDPLGMTRSTPGQLVPWGQAVVADLPIPYAVSGDTTRPVRYPAFGVEPSADLSQAGMDPVYRIPAATDSARRALLGADYTPLFSSQTAAGEIATMLDLAKFDIAYDAGRLVSAATREAMFTPSRTADGRELPYGLGWFIERINAQRVVWHYGWFPPSVSALWLKVPEQHLTLLLASNSDRLSAGMSWTAEGVRASPYARLFLRMVARID